MSSNTQKILTFGTIILVLFSAVYIYTWLQVTSAAKESFESIDLENPDLEIVELVSLPPSATLELTYLVNNPSGYEMFAIFDFQLFFNGELVDDIYSEGLLEPNNWSPISFEIEVTSEMILSSLEQMDVEWDYDGKIVIKHEMLGLVPISMSQNLRAI